MSWKRAQEDAQNWLDGLQLPKDLRGSGRLVDLREAAKSIRGAQGYRIMGLRAAARLLKHREINALLPETK